MSGSVGGAQTINLLESLNVGREYYCITPVAMQQPPRFPHLGYDYTLLGYIANIISKLIAAMYVICPLSNVASPEKRDRVSS